MLSSWEPLKNSETSLRTRQDPSSITVRTKGNIHHLLKGGTKMYWILSYDIKTTRLRNRVITIAKNYGFSRLQKSVFSADTSTERINELQHSLNKTISQKLQDKDSILLIPVSANPKHQLISVGPGTSSPQQTLPEYLFISDESIQIPCERHPAEIFWDP